MKISLFYDNVTVLDYAYLDDQRGVVGNSLKVNVQFIGETDEEGVVYDFSLAKKKVKEIIDRDCDHRLVIPRKLAQNVDGNISFEYSYGFSENSIVYRAPEEGVCEIPFAYVSNENLQSYLEEKVLAEMPKTVKAIKLEFEEEKLEEYDSFFHYTHGLKEHYGNCQRLLHGHRSTLKILVNGVRDIETERYMTEDLFSGNIHFALWENIVNKEEIITALSVNQPEGRYENLPEVEIKYESSQGEFYAKLPGREVYLLQSETTVENLSIHFAKMVKEKLSSNDNCVVYAYEGIAKGSITAL
jgi:6-pyruvoyl-tetrahydropterin synthase